MGQDIEHGLGLRFEGEDDPIERVLEWGVRALEVPVKVAGRPRPPGRRERRHLPRLRRRGEGGLLLVLTPAK